MRIGVGVTFYNRPEHREAWSMIHSYMIGKDIVYHIEIETDENRLGVAKRKNNCLRALKDCDHIFLFDEDCRPIKVGWIENFINSGHKHLLYLNSSHRPFIHCGDGSTVYCDCGGVFMYMTKDVVERVGAFNEKFTPYGFEHADYSRRIAKAMGEHYNYRALDNTSEFIYAEDYSNPNHKSSITDEEKKKHVRNNWDKFFKEPIKDIYIPL